MHSTLPQHDIVLVGIGHTNAHVLRMWRMEPIPRARLTCISNYPVATYSGMLPGTLAGQYEPQAMEIDLVRLCASAGARLILGDVVGLDRDRRELLLADRPSVPFDALSVGIGSVPTREGLVAADDTLLPIKPMQTFLDRLQSRLSEIASCYSFAWPLQIVIVGGGVGGVEVAFCVHHVAQEVLLEEFQLTLIHDQERLVPGTTVRTARRVLDELMARGVNIVPRRRVRRVTDAEVELDNGDVLPAQIVLWATSAIAPPLLVRLGLQTDERGFLLTRPTLQSTADERIFAVGDSGTIEGQAAPKAGVYAVRQGPILWENLQRLVRREPLIAYRPQQGFLKLINTGDGRAIGEFLGLTFSGGWVWRLKDRIDRKFMAMYQDYTPTMMRGSDDDKDGQPRQVRCLGCGGKVGGTVLARVLARLDIPPHPSVPLGLATPDDVALVQSTGNRPLAVTTDFFAPPLDDPYLVGRIAALHAASDVLAKGARPIAALAIATIPPGSEKQQEQLLYELLAGGLVELKAMGATLVGGHTIEGPQTAIGYTILAEPTRATIRTKGGLRVGDVLVLTKPLGIGVLLAAQMQARLKAPWYEPLLAALLASNQPAAQVLDELEIPAATDVTGFGLAGHLLEMLRSAGVSAELQLDQIPLLPGTAELLAEGLESTLAPANREAIAEMDFASAIEKQPAFAALFDPQTCGGLLFGVKPDEAEAIIARLEPAGAAIIGRVVAASVGRGTRLAGRLRVRQSSRGA